MKASISERERAKYAAIWAMGDYSDNSPGEQMVEMFMRIARPHPGQKVLDIGAGAGAGSRALATRGLAVQAFDLVDAGWNNPAIRLKTGNIWRDLPRFPGRYEFDFGYCCDVMEHVPTQFVALSIAEMLISCERVFLSISFKQDVHGDAIRDRLHLTIESFTWWRDTLRELGTLLDARDLIGDGVFYVGR
jgi:2-polyprenyl-3-methyl-5-hydroxy-6-metoxy-1,4-benzoquinol methylase